MLAMAVVNYEDEGGTGSKKPEVEEDVLSTLRRLHKTLQECHGRVGSMNKRMDILQPKFTKTMAETPKRVSQKNGRKKFIDRLQLEPECLNRLDSFSHINGHHDMNGGNNEIHDKDLGNTLIDNSDSKKEPLKSIEITMEGNSPIKSPIPSSPYFLPHFLHNINDTQDLVLLAEKHAEEICKMYQLKSNTVAKGQNPIECEEKCVMMNGNVDENELPIPKEMKPENAECLQKKAKSLDFKYFNFECTNGQPTEIGSHAREKSNLRNFAKRKEWWYNIHKGMEKNSKTEERFGIQDNILPEKFNGEVDFLNVFEANNTKDSEDFFEPNERSEKRKLRKFAKRKEYWSEFYKGKENGVDKMVGETSCGYAESDASHGKVNNVMNLDDSGQELQRRFSDQLSERCHFGNDNVNEHQEKNSNGVYINGETQVQETEESGVKYFSVKNSPYDANFSCETNNAIDVLFERDTLSTTICENDVKPIVFHRKRKRHILQRMRSVDLEDLPEECENPDNIQTETETNNQSIMTQVASTSVGTEEILSDAEKTIMTSPMDASTSGVTEKVPSGAEKTVMTSPVDASTSLVTEKVPFNADKTIVTSPVDAREIEIVSQKEDNGHIKVSPLTSFNGPECQVNNKVENVEESLDAFRKKFLELYDSLTHLKKIQSSNQSTCTDNLQSIFEVSDIDLSNSNGEQYSSRLENCLCKGGNSKHIEFNKNKRWKKCEKDSESLKKMYKLSGDSYKECKAKKVKRRSNIMERLRSGTCSEKVLLISNEGAPAHQKVRYDFGNLIYKFMSLVSLVLLAFVLYIFLTVPIVTVSLRHNGGPVAF